MSKSIIQHANMMVIDNTGVLIVGAPNIGKSEISLALLDRGHQFVSDDATQLIRENNIMIASCPDINNYFMQLDYVGLINVEKMFGVTSCLPQHRVDLCIALTTEEASDTPTPLLTPKLIQHSILGMNVPCYELVVMIGKQLPLLIEMLVKNINIEKTGYNALEDLQQRQHIELNRKLSCKKEH